MDIELILSLAIVPFMYLSIRYYMSTLLNREEHVKELESSLVQRLYETFAAMRLVKSFARERHEAGRFSTAGEQTKAARISLTAYRENLSLREAALALGYVSGEEFDRWVRPADMTRPLDADGT